MGKENLPGEAPEFGMGVKRRFGLSGRGIAGRVRGL